MRLLERNKSNIFFANQESYEDFVDEYGNKTGSRNPKYGTPVKARVHCSAASGELVVSLFGQSVQYDKVLLFDRGAYSIDENTVLWIDALDISKPHDYRVSKVASSLNVTAVAVRRVKVSG